MEKQGRKPWMLREFGGKTLWDWLQLLIVPVVLSLITVVFAWQQDIRQDQIENKRAEADLTNADLTDAQGVTTKDLEQVAGSLDGATMPNGQKYEDRLKDKENRREAE